MLIENLKPTHSGALGKYFGAQVVENLSRNMKNFYYPIGITGVPGNIYAMPGGDFAGKILTDGEMDVNARFEEAYKREKRALGAQIFRNRIAVSIESALGKLGHRYNAFASADAVYAALTGGKAQFFSFVKTGVASNAAGNGVDLWTALTSQPAAGAAAGAAPGGTVPTNSTTGAFGYVNPSSANSGHFLRCDVQASVVNMGLLLYDRIFAVAKAMNSTTAEAVTGVPTRYQNQTSTNLDYIGGNFVFPSNPTTVLPATAHNWTVCQYTNQAGTTGQTIPSIAGVASCVLRGIDLLASTPGWFMPLATGDVGIGALTQMQSSAVVATGTIDFVMAHPIAFMPCYAAAVIWPQDGLRGTVNLTSIFDNACLAFLEMPKPATTATTYSGLLTVVSE